MAYAAYDSYSFSLHGVYLDALYRSIKPGEIVLLRKGNFVRWYTVEQATSIDWTVQASQTITTKVGSDTIKTTVPAVKKPVTRCHLSAAVEQPRPVCARRH